MTPKLWLSKPATLTLAFFYFDNEVFMQHLTIPTATLQALLSHQQIATLDNTNQLIELEQSSLEKLRSRQLKENYQQFLNGYDRLFRHVSILLLEHGYALTDFKPHQSLRKICQQWQADVAINQMINERHRLKKSQQAPLSINNQAIDCLHHLLNLFDEQDAAEIKAIFP